MLAENNTGMRKFLTNRNILTQELENAAILKDLVPIQGEIRIMFDAIVKILTEKFQKSLEDDSILEIPKTSVDEAKGKMQQVMKRYF